MLAPIDYAVIVVYLLGVAGFGIYAGGSQQDTDDYFLGGRDLPWWAITFSIVATETSTLTVLGIPAIAYGGSWVFFQLTLGYLIGRIIVSFLFLPKYFSGNLQTAYAFLGDRFGDRMRVTASITFLVTRLLADGVRLFATAIPIKVIADSLGYDLSYFSIILVIAVLTTIYTFIGGIKAVVWMDVVQMVVYVGGGILVVVFLLGDVPENWWSVVSEAGKTQWTAWDGSLAAILTQPYLFLTALVGGAVFTMASHGTDQLIVQRVLSCRNQREGQKAMVASAFLIQFQFALFLLLGTLLWVYYQGASLDMLGLSRGDEVFPKYMIESLPAGIAGLLLAGILAAAMSTLSSSLNALASSTIMDLVQSYMKQGLQGRRALDWSKRFTVVWGVVFVGFASLFESQENPVVELGLAIAAFTYGGLLGAFLLGLWNKRAQQGDALIAFAVTVLALILFNIAIWYAPDVGWTWVFAPSDETIAAQQLTKLAWPWFPALGSLITLAVGSLLALRHRSQ